MPVGRQAPTVVLVHGARADASSWAGEVRMLQRAGVRVRAIANPVEDLTTDARYVADFLKTVRGPIVLVGHSYGGAVITNAAAGVPGVKALVYVDASAPAPGETNAQLSGSRSVLTTGNQGKLYKTVPRPSYAPGAHELYLRKAVFVEGFASDLPRAEAVRLGVSAWGIHRRVHDPFANGRLEDDPVLVLRQHWRQDHHAGLTAGHGPPRPSPRDDIPRRLAPNADLTSGGSRVGHRLRDLRHHPLTNHSALTPEDYDDHLRCAIHSGRSAQQHQGS